MAVQKSRVRSSGPAVSRNYCASKENLRSNGMRPAKTPRLLPLPRQRITKILDLHKLSIFVALCRRTYRQTALFLLSSAAHEFTQVRARLHYLDTSVVEISHSNRSDRRPCRRQDAAGTGRTMCCNLACKPGRRLEFLAAYAGAEGSNAGRFFSSNGQRPHSVL
jgi:hypothetical protein